MYSFLCPVYVKMELLVWVISIVEEDRMAHYFIAGNLSLIVKIKGAAKCAASFSLATLKFKYVYRSGFVQGL